MAMIGMQELILNNQILQNKIYISVFFHLKLLGNAPVLLMKSKYMPYTKYTKMFRFQTPGISNFLKMR